MGIFGRNEDSVAFEDEEIQEQIADDTVSAGDVADGADVPADVDSSDMPEGDDADEEIVDDDEMVEDEDDDPSCDGCDELDTTMNPAADMVDVSADGNTATAAEDDDVDADMGGDDEDFAAEDDELADTAQDATAPTPFDPKTMPESNLD